MKMVKLTLWAYEPAAFTGRSWLFCKLICLWTKAKYAHVGFSYEDRYIEADFVQGVISLSKVPTNAIAIHSWVVEDLPNTDKWLDAQIGKPYDIWGILGFVIGPSPDGRLDHGHWFCSEIAATFLALFSIKPCGTTPAWEITPEMLIDAITKSLTKYSQLD